MKSCDKFEGVVDSLRSMLGDPPRGVVGIDGVAGVGKTKFASLISGELDARVVSLDDFVESNKGTYVAHLRLNELVEALAAGGSLLVVEGVCLLSALARVAVKPDVLIYVQRVSSSGQVYDDDVIDPIEDPDTLIRRMADAVALMQRMVPKHDEAPAPEAIPELMCEIIRYHDAFRPRDRADVLFCVVEADS